jgi:hypothetical protein
VHTVRVKVVADALDANATIAAASRTDFDRVGVRVVNLMGIPGRARRRYWSASCRSTEWWQGRWRATCRAASTPTGWRIGTCR